MKSLSVRFKKLNENAVVPRYQKNGDAGLDLTAVSMTENELYIEYDTGLAVEVPEGYVGLVYPRSSLSNYHLVLSNHVGVVDSNYRGSIKFRFKKTKEHSPASCIAGHLIDEFNPSYYKVGDRIGQLIIMQYPLILVEESDELSDTDRGSLGFGSSGK